MYLYMYPVPSTCTHTRTYTDTAKICIHTVFVSEIANSSCVCVAACSQNKHIVSRINTQYDSTNQHKNVGYVLRLRIVSMLVSAVCSIRLYHVSSCTMYVFEPHPF